MRRSRHTMSFALRGAAAAAGRASAHARRIVPRMCAHAHTAASNAGFSLRLTDEQRALQELARRFAKEEMIPRSRQYDQSGEWPREVFVKAWEAGLVNMHIPEEYGGPGLHSLEGVIVAEELAYADAGMLAAMEINTVAEVPIMLAGTEEQKREYLGRMVREPLVAAYCVTEPGAGSDVAGVRTRAEKRGDEWILNGSKMWITNGGIANWYFVLARTGAPTDGPGSAFTAFVVDRDTPGITVGKKERMMGQRCSDTRGITFQDVRVPAKNVLGAPGKGFKIAMGAFDLTRPPVAAGAVGLARRALDEALVYSQTRVTMGKPIAQHQAVAFMLADMATNVEAARLLTHKSAWLVDNGKSNTVAASAAKLFAGGVVNKVVADAVQIFGGLGYNEDAPVAKLFRDAKIYDIYEGTREIQKLIISRELLTDPTKTLPSE